MRPWGNTLFLLLSLCSGAASAQTLEKRFVYEHLGERDGLLHAEVTAIRQDRQGLMWFGTLAGLWCYDGSQFRYFTHNFHDSTTLHGSAVRHFWEDANSDIWVQFPDGLSRFHRKTETFSFIPIKNGRLSAFGALPDAWGHIWTTWRGLHGKNSVVALEPTTGQAVFQSGQLPDGRYLTEKVKVLSLASDGRLWLLDGAQVFALWATETGWRGPVECYTLPETSIEWGNDGFFQDSEGTAWAWLSDLSIFFKKKGASRFEQLTAAKAPMAILGAGAGGHHAIFKDFEGNIWFCSRAGILIVSPTTGASQVLKYLPNESQSLPNERMLSFCLDKTGVVWVGHDFGISKLRQQPAAFELFRPHPLAAAAPAQSNKVYGICEGRDGILWIGAPDIGLIARNLQTGQQRIHRFPLHQVEHKSAMGVLETQDGALWVGSWEQGLWRFDRARGQLVQVASPDPLHPWRMHVIRSLLETRDGRLWIGRLHGVSVLDPRTGLFTHYDMPNPPSDGMGGQHVFGLCQDAKGSVWAGTANCNLYEFPSDGSPIKVFPFPSAASVLSLHFDPDSNVLWVGTQGDGLARFSLTTRSFDQFYGYPQGLSGNMVYGILPDGRGNLWLSTNNGVFRFRPSSRIFVRYGREDGLPDDDLYTIAYQRGRADRLYFGCLSGLIAFVPAEVQRLEKALGQRTALVFTSAEIAGQAQQSVLYTPQPANELVVSPGQQGVLLRFALLDYSFPDKKLYRWQLEGLDTGWSLPQSKGEVRYLHLPRGVYVFQVETLDETGAPVSNPLKVKIVVQAFFWHQEEFWAVVAGLLVLAGLWTFMEYRAALTRAARQAQSAALRSQMNPHFLHNTLNTAAAFVATRARREGVEFLAQASSLFRTMLEESAQEYVALRDEVLFLKNYVDLQQHRHPEKFEFEIQIAPDLDTAAVQVPALLLQPLLETPLNTGWYRAPAALVCFIYISSARTNACW